MRLRIRTMFVEAMEREDWATVGEPVYVRGFVRNYAKLLGLDPTPFLDRLAQDYPAQQQPAPTDLLASATFYDRPVRLAKWYPWVLGALTVIAGVLVINVAVGLFSVLYSGGQHQTAGNVPVVQAPVVTQNANNGSTSNTLQAAAQNTNGGVNLRLQLTQPSWLSITVDGKRVVYETLPAGTVRLFHGAREISLRAGNAGGVVANFDGQDLGTLGHAGQVEDRVFAAKTPPYQFTRPHE